MDEDGGRNALRPNSLDRSRGRTRLDARALRAGSAFRCGGRNNGNARCERLVSGAPRGDAKG